MVQASLVIVAPRYRDTDLPYRCRLSALRTYEALDTFLLVRTNWNRCVVLNFAQMDQKPNQVIDSNAT